MAALRAPFRPLHAQLHPAAGAPRRAQLDPQPAQAGRRPHPEAAGPQRPAAGGLLSDIFGLNGRRILDGLVAQQPAEAILAGQTGHVRTKLEQLAETLAATLEDESLCQLRGHLQACDHASALLAEIDLTPAQDFPDAERLGA